MILSVFCLNYVCGLDIAEKSEDQKKKEKQLDFCSCGQSAYFGIF